MINEVEVQAERLTLSCLLKSPERFFMSTSVLSANDFSDPSCRCVYGAVQDIFSSDSSDEDAINKAVLLNKIALSYPEHYKRSATEIEELIEYIVDLPNLNNRDFKQATEAVLKNSVARRANKTLDELKKNIGYAESYRDILGKIESSVFEFTSSAVCNSDMIKLGDNYKQQLSRREKDILEGRSPVGIGTGFNTLDDMLGGGLVNGLHVVGARSGKGKSFFALKISDYVASQNIPVLYLDTELEEEQQNDRRICQSMDVPFKVMKYCLYLNDDKYKEKVYKGIERLENHPIHYVSIKGWSLDKIVSIIRKFFAQVVKRRADGQYNKALVVLDYMKLMRSEDKGYDKEYERLGFMMTMLHDLIMQYNNPGLVFVQLNRDALSDREDEGVISGSDRISWLSDSLTLLLPMSEEEMMNRTSEYEERFDKEEPLYNMRVKVIKSRHGNGTKGSSYISFYFDIHDTVIDHRLISGQIKEGRLCKTVISNGNRNK